MEGQPEEKAEKTSQAKQKLMVALVVLVIVGAGALTGYFMANRSTLVGVADRGPGTEKRGSEVGSTDTQTFKDAATGVLEKGGVDGEGTHKLIREGGPSQTAYLTSSVINLDQFIGKKVQVWGETFAGQKAGWLMDVGRVKILE